MALDYIYTIFVHLEPTRNTLKARLIKKIQNLFVS